MNRTKKIISIFTVILLFSSLNAAASFTGYAGGKLNYSSSTKEPDSSEEDGKTYDPDLKLQAFIAGQFNFSQNLWAHMEFSIDTEDFISDSLFSSTPSLFQIDELSLIARSMMPTSSNYFSVYMGTYDPIGSDIFLQRYFGCEPIASKITESWLGLAGSILYPHFGVGISDVIKFHFNPFALGFYAYINHEDDRYYVFNSDIRTACVCRYFSWDFACGIGAPLSDKFQGSDVIIAIEKLYWHAGTTMLIGNNYTQGLFLQGGIFNASFNPKSKMIVGKDDIYLLFEPRFVKQNTHINITAYSVPQATVQKLLFVDDTLGADINIYWDSIVAGSHSLSVGTHISGSFTDKTFLDFAKIKEITSNGFNINFTPYISTNFLNGELHGQLKVKFMEFAKGVWYNAFSADIGYTCNL